MIGAHLGNEEMNDSGLSHTLSHLILTVDSEIYTFITILQIQKLRLERLSNLFEIRLVVSRVRFKQRQYVGPEPQ